MVESREHLFRKIIEEKMLECRNMTELDKKNTAEISTKSCEAVWDTVMCWPRTQADFLQKLPCPKYIPGFNPQEYATRFCTEMGTWQYRTDTQGTYTNYTNCKLPHSPNPSPPPDIIANWLPVIKQMSNIGYGVSFVALILALTILTSIKKLRCPRNTLHMHLFLSFMFRAFMNVLKTALFIDGLGMKNSIISHEGEETRLSFNNQHPNWECKLVISLWQYAIVANYAWILAEGAYLHNLIFVAPFSDSSAITIYVILGWGSPVLVVGAWVIARIYADDVLCWTTHDNPDQLLSLFLIIKAPIIISIVVNFILFVNIVRVLLVKLQSSVSLETRKYRYRKWAKSTLVLVPLFGVHYMIFLGMTYYVGKNPLIEVIWLFCDQLFASFQGFFVSVLYCLLNGEVRKELRKLWSTWRSSHRDDDDKSIPLNRISSKFRSTGVDNSMPNELTEEQQINDLSYQEERRRIRGVVDT